MNSKKIKNLVFFSLSVICLVLSLFLFHLVFFILSVIFLALTFKYRNYKPEKTTPSPHQRNITKKRKCPKCNSIITSQVLSFCPLCNTKLKEIKLQIPTNPKELKKFREVQVKSGKYNKKKIQHLTDDG